MEYKDYYKIMGLSEDASQDDIKHAYRKLARKFHPDVSKEQDAEEKFKTLGEAYEVLKDPEKRAKYDQYNQHWKQQGSASQRDPFAEQRSYNSYSSQDNEVDFEEFINSIFGQHAHGPGTRRSQKGKDITASVTISLEDSFLGAEKTVLLSQAGEQKTIKIKIPKGVTHLQQIRLKGQGEKGSGQTGDLYITIHLQQHPFFRHEKKDIYLHLPISPWEAALGKTVPVPTLGGTVSLKIPKHSQSNQKMRLKARGLPGNPSGDQFVILEIVLPPNENEKANELYQQLSELSDFNPRQKLGVQDV